MPEITNEPVGHSLLLVLARKVVRVRTSKPDRSGLIENYGKLVHKIASRYKKTGVSYDDLYQTGIVGLLEAYKDFKEHKGCQFSTYAHWHINSRIRLLCRKNRRISEFEIVDVSSGTDDIGTILESLRDPSGLDAEYMLQAKNICEGIENVFKSVRPEEKLAIIVGLGIASRKQAAEDYGCSVTAISNWKAVVFDKIAKEVDSSWPSE